MCSSCSTSTLQNFNPVDLVFVQIFHILLFNIILCPQCDATSHLIGFNGAETNCGIAHILGILLMNSYIFSNYYYLQSVHFELQLRRCCEPGLTLVCIVNLLRRKFAAYQLV